MTTSLDIRDVAIIDALPTYQVGDLILNIGCGEGRIDRYLASVGYAVYAVDVKWHESWYETPCSGSLEFVEGDIFKPKELPLKSAPVVLCSEVLEHLQRYKEALENLIKLAEVRLIITIPVERSFNDKRTPPEGHCNWWNDDGSDGFTDVHEFEELCRPYSVSIMKIRTKPRDVDMKQRSYLIVVDKRQKWDAFVRC